MSQPGAEPNPTHVQTQTNGDPDAQPQQIPQTTVQVTPAEPVETFDRDYVEQLRREAAAARTANKALQKKVEDAARANMSEHEQALAKVREDTAAEIRREYGSRLATSEFRTQAVASGISAEQLPALLEDLAIDRFLNDDGEPDTKKIAARVKSWSALAAPAQPQGRQSFDGGARQTAVATSMDDIIRGQVGIHR